MILAPAVLTQFHGLLFRIAISLLVSVLALLPEINTSQKKRKEKCSLGTFKMHQVFKVSKSWRGKCYRRWK